MVIYGWYSEEAFKTNKIGYLYSDKNNRSQLCTIVSDENICPYYQPLNIFKENVVFLGELNRLICSIPYKSDIIKSKYNKNQRLKKLRSFK